MTALDKRNPPLKRIYIQCPACGRVLKARAKRLGAKYIVYNSEQSTVWVIDKIPRHKITVRGSGRLRNLLLTGEDNSKKWCNVRPVPGDDGTWNTPQGLFKILGQRHRKPRGKSLKSS